MFFARPRKIYSNLFIAALVFPSATLLSAPQISAKTIVQNNSNLGIIKGIIRDGDGSPIADAYVSIFRVGTTKLLKQVRSAADGSFLAKIIPGTYTVLAVAEGFNATTVREIEINRADELNYGFNLVRSGAGNTLPEKRLDRSSSKWRIRNAQIQRSIYQNRKGNAPVEAPEIADSDADPIANADRDMETKAKGSQTIVETYFTDAPDGNFTGLNFATLLPVSEKTEVVFAGQTGTKNAPQRFETTLKTRINDKHQLNLQTSVGNLGKIKNGQNKTALGQFSFQALDEFTIKNGVILVLGFDYSRFIGAGGDSSISPRFGLQFDLNAKTRVRTAYTEKTVEKDWTHAAELENTSIAFTEPQAIEDFTLNKGKPQLNKSRRMEIGVERILDNCSSVEANVFFDATPGRGVGLLNVPIQSLGNESLSRLTGTQQGNAQGLRVVYSRRLSNILSASAGYSFGSGQKLSENAISKPSELFENGIFQSFYGQINASLKTGTNVKTIYRLSPEATVFAIDPFQGRLAIYDPGLSVFVTQTLPNLGLPIRAEAIVDAKNLFDFQTNVSNSEGSLRLNSQHRTVRGGILVRF